MKILTIELPDSVDISLKEATIALAAQLYDMGKLSLGQAANLAGYSKATFMELLSNYNVSIFNYSSIELDQDIENAKNYHI
jgi:predicted HTH domain antitoxin